MPAYLIDLLSWTLAFVGLFLGFRYLQKRKERRDDD